MLQVVYSEYSKGEFEAKWKRLPVRLSVMHSNALVRTVIWKVAD